MARTTRKSPYPCWFLLPAGSIYFLVPTVSSVYFSFTSWDPFEARWAGWENYVRFFFEPYCVLGTVNTLVFAFLTLGLKTVLGLLLAVLLTAGLLGQSLLRSIVFFPVLVSTIGVGILFKEMMHPTEGVPNLALEAIGLSKVGFS